MDRKCMECGGIDVGLEWDYTDASSLIGTDWECYSCGCQWIEWDRGGYTVEFHGSSYRSRGDKTPPSD